MSQLDASQLSKINHPRPCLKCGNMFTPTSHRQKYCPPCGKEVKRQQSKAAGKRFFAKRGGSSAGYFKEKGYKESDYFVECTCIICGSKFQAKKGSKTCKDECLLEAKRRQVNDMRARGLLGKQGNGEIELMLRYAFIAAGFPVSDIVEEPNKPVVSQYPILGSDGAKRYTPDFAIPSHKIAIEADESFWHSEPGTRFEGCVSNAQRRASGNDHNKEAYLVSHGWKLFRFWESRIREDARGCVAEVVAFMESIWLTPHPTPGAPSPSTPVRDCEWCHDPFSPEGNQVKYCCDSCSLMASREKSRLRVEHYNQRRGTTSAQRMHDKYHEYLVEITCVVCGTKAMRHKGVKTCGKPECSFARKSQVSKGRSKPK